MLKFAKMILMVVVVGSLSSFVLPAYSGEVDDIQKAIEDQKRAFEQLRKKLDQAKGREKKIQKIEQSLLKYPFFII